MFDINKTLFYNWNNLIYDAYLLYIKREQLIMKYNDRRQKKTKKQLKQKEEMIYVQVKENIINIKA